MIILPVEIQVCFIIQLRYVLRIPAGFIPVSRIRKQRIDNFPVKHAFRGGKGAFHFIVNHAV